MKRSENSLKAKCATFQRDVHVWLSCRSRINMEQTTGNWSDAKILAMTHALYFGQERTQTTKEVGESGSSMLKLQKS